MCRMSPCRGRRGLHTRSKARSGPAGGRSAPPHSSYWLHTLGLLVISGLRASSFHLRLKRGHAVADRCLPRQTFQLLIKPTQLVVKVKKKRKETNRTKTKGREKKRRRKQSDARRQKLVPGLVETSHPPAQPAWYVNTTIIHGTSV